MAQSEKIAATIGEIEDPVQINFGGREIAIKLVYYGPALSGKTTNLRSLHQLTTEGAAGAS